MSRSTIEDLAEVFEQRWHKEFPEGMAVSECRNSDVPSTCFLAGAKAQLDLLEAKHRKETRRLQTSKIEKESDT